MKKEIINTEKAPKAIGPYSQGVKIGDLIFTSGQIPINPETGEFINDDVKKATEMCIKNVKAILGEAGTSLENVIKTTVFVSDMNNFTKVNEIYGEYFKDNPPARSCVEVSKLPKGALVEIEVIATLK